MLFLPASLLRSGRPAQRGISLCLCQFKGTIHLSRPRRDRALLSLSPQVVDYFKGLADETGLPYQKLIDLYLLDCAKKRKKLTMKWVA